MYTCLAHPSNADDTERGKLFYICSFSQAGWLLLCSTNTTEAANTDAHKIANDTSKTGMWVDEKIHHASVHEDAYA